MDKSPSQEIGERVIRVMLDFLEPKGINLAVQSCEHLNRILVVEKTVALKN